MSLTKFLEIKQVNLFNIINYSRFDTFQSLITLDLQINEIGDKGTYELANMLKKNQVRKFF